jgi:molybdopterin/thiamine biosynthesis adenylyltransferase/rhodanese-related sulfurtransferase
MRDDFLRYSCQIALPGFNESSQEKLLHSRVLVVGAGGLGCPAAQYLAAAGIGHIGIADFDIISISNLHRQILYTPLEAGFYKAVVAAKKLQQQNPSISVEPLTLKVSSDNVMELVSRFDVIVDGTDNFETRYLLNDAAVLSGKPLVYGGIYQFEGQVAVWNLLMNDGSRSPNYRDVFPDVDASQVPNCAEGGVLPTLAGVIGCMQANEVIKIITGTGETLAGKMLLVDLRAMETRQIKIGDRSKVKITSLPQSTEIPGISSASLREGIDADLYQLVDVRTTQERELFHIGGDHLPLDQFEQRMNELRSDRQLVFYCASGKRSEEAAKRFKKQHPSAMVFSLEGGLKRWHETRT